MALAVPLVSFFADWWLSVTYREAGRGRGGRRGVQEGWCVVHVVCVCVHVVGGGEQVPEGVTLAWPSLFCH